MGCMGLQKVTQLKNGAVMLEFSHLGGEKSLRTVTAGGELSLAQVAALVGVNLVRAWRAAKAGRLKARKRGGVYKVTVKEAGRWGRSLKAGG